MEEHTESQSQLRLDGETDRLYKAVPTEGPVTVLEEGEASVEIRRDSLDDVVVWNPGPEKAASMSDFGPEDGWKHMRTLLLLRSDSASISTGGCAVH